MSEQLSKGMMALRRSGNRPEKITVNGEIFYFRKLTIELEEQLDNIIKSSQDPTLKPPEALAEDADEAARKAFEDAALDYRQRAAKSFRKLTAEIMRFTLTDENAKPFFTAEDDIYGMLDNVYAQTFFTAYQRFRGGTTEAPSATEARFQG